MNLNRITATDIQSQPYVAAEPLRPIPRAEMVWIVLEALFDLIVCYFRCIPLWIRLVLDTFHPPAPKTISGQNALITGGANGIGRAIATELAKEGCNVIIVDEDQVNAEKTAAELKAFNVDAFSYKCDVADYEQVKELRGQVETDVGSVDILINNAGILSFLLPNENNPSMIQRMMEVNALAGFWTVEQFLPGMTRQRRGHIVAIASASSYFPVGWMKNYVTTKYAVRGYMEALDEELYLAGQSDYVKTTTVFPFVVNTRKQVMDAINRKRGLSKMPKYSPEETAATVLKAIKNNQRKVVVPDRLKAWQLSFYEHIPIEIRRKLDLAVMKEKPIVLD
ncbi:estradiol 17-beta-dehydrogenase 11-like [Toxorhynchites rutilus septentrionalis]|uniref:estradiol 17-beta-dehydrogenase 11-like n=1 Tax=Toxorhynchites rutilus septentrionalis TaxID=329112 RepID=UPI0024795CB8|nr:estradiol 17-beta-dehydrogenase 11-like [Toxorhynchites rutilus septentrionalis]